MNLIDKVRAFSGINISKSLEEKLKLNRPLRIKYGIDPTTAHVHLGHTVPLRLLRSFQDAGHLPIIILGDFTASIGDPTGRNETRTEITPEETKANARKYLSQIGKIVNVEKSEVHLNSTWLNKCDLRWVIEQFQKFTISQILDREDFSNRYKGGVPIQMHELMYPLLQAYDSVVVEADVELGATEQLFNLNMGRDMQKFHNQEPQVCITLPILRGLDGEKKMGKSLNNFITVTEEPFEMFSKVMSIPDKLISEWTMLLTDGWIFDENPMLNKKTLGRRIVEQLYDFDIATKAELEWVRQFSERKEPTDIPVHQIEAIENSLVNVIMLVGLASSKNNARRLIEGGGVDWNGVKISDVLMRITPQTKDRLRVGRKYIEVKIV